MTWSVHDLNASISEQLRNAFADDLWVRGEIHDLHRPQSGHVYFSLVDHDGGGGANAPRAKLAVVLTARDKDRVNRLLRRGGNVRMTDGTEVRIRGRVEFYEARGQVQLRMLSIDPAFTLGQLAMARAQLLIRLRADGIANANATRPMAMAPLRVGLLTSAGSAAHADVADELARSGYAFAVEVIDVRVQGADAVASITEALTWCSSLDLDVVLLARGGGSTTDLAAFDHELVARAIAACPHPVVTGIGHEIDRSVADEVAHTAAKTPTAAAQHLVRLVAEAESRAEHAFASIVAHTSRRLHRAELHLDRLRARTTTAATAATRIEQQRIALAGDQLIRRAGMVLDRHTRRRSDDAIGLARSSERRLHEAAGRIDLLAAQVAVADPARALARGWTMTRRADGTMVRSRGDVAPGETLHTTFVDGIVTSTVVPEESAS